MKTGNCLKLLWTVRLKALGILLSYDATARRHRKTTVIPGIIVVLHTYGRDLGFNPHIHVIMSEGGFDQNKECVNIPYISYTALRKTWQYRVLTNLKKQIPDTKENKQLIDRLFKKNANGFYVRVKDKITSFEVIRYIGRYVRHPAIANSRIVDYDGETATFS